MKRYEEMSDHEILMELIREKRRNDRLRYVRYGIYALILAVLIALSRLYIGIHYPTDVAFGIISGIACGFLGVFLYREFFER